MSQDYRPSVVSLVGQVIDGKYQVLSILGEGGMGAVYKARTQDGSHVAVKVLHQELGDNPELQERFQREIQALFALKHPNVLAAHDAGVVDGSPYLAMELLEGAPLDKYIEDTPPDPQTAMYVMRQVLAGLAFAHAKGAAHRDLKAENVFLSKGPDGRPIAKLLDFGLVKFTDDAKWGNNRKLTVQGSVFGTPAYMAPEQALGQNTDARTDVYSAGCILFELLTGEWPFMEETQMMMLQAHIMKKPRLIAETRLDLAVRPELEDVIQRAMAKKPQDRYADAGQMLAALDAMPQPPVALRPSDGSDPFKVRAAAAHVPAPAQAPVYASHPGMQAPMGAPPMMQPAPASHPAAPAGPNKVLLIGAGFVIALVAAAVVFWLAS